MLSFPFPRNQTAATSWNAGIPHFHREKGWNACLERPRRTADRVLRRRMFFIDNRRTFASTSNIPRGERGGCGVRGPVGDAHKSRRNDTHFVFWNVSYDVPVPIRYTHFLKDRDRKQQLSLYLHCITSNTYS